ncbi:MAG: hypothetical protein ACREQK_09600, partial [Candidatus Binatia bacterium]
ERRDGNRRRESCGSVQPTNSEHILEAVAQIKPADVFNGLVAVGLQQPSYLRTERKIIDQETAHIQGGFILNDQNTSVERLRDGDLYFF